MCLINVNIEIADDQQKKNQCFHENELHFPRYILYERKRLFWKKRE